MKKLPLPDIELLRHLFDYDAESGLMVWKNPAYRGVTGRVVGSSDRCGYLQVNYKGRMMMVHRICYAIYHGIDPVDMEIDHINGDRKNNKIENLRAATRKQNTSARHNLHGGNTSGKNGVSLDKESGKWKAYACGKTIGRFDDIVEAGIAVKNFRAENLGEFCGSV